ncbi:hypothetical protein A2U01_0080265, partial [Trifolium medium]|nr:hypothetical protein [Trifolium medium]
ERQIARPTKRIGKIFGKFMLLLKPNIYYGGYANGVYLLVSGYKNDVYRVH